MAPLKLSAALGLLLSLSCQAAEIPARGLPGMLDIGASAPPASPPPVERTVLVAGERHFCLLWRGGVFCGGDNDSGQLGQGDRKPHQGLMPVPLTQRAVALEENEDRTCAVVVTGQVYCWGDRNIQFGPFSMYGVPNPFSPYPLERIRDARATFTDVIHTSAGMHGRPILNYKTAFLDGAGALRWAPFEEEGATGELIPGFTNVRGFAGSGTTCGYYVALDERGRLWVQGFPGDGRGPRALDHEKAFRSFLAGCVPTSKEPLFYAIREDGAVFCGDGAGALREAAGAGPAAALIESGADRSMCVLREGGEVRCFQQATCDATPEPLPRGEELSARYYPSYSEAVEGELSSLGAAQVAASREGLVALTRDGALYTAGAYSSFGPFALPRDAPPATRP